MGTTARAVMQGPALTVGPDTPLAKVQRILVEQRIHGVPVVDAEGGLLGVVSSTDLLALGLAVEGGEHPRPAAIDYLAELLEYSPDETHELTRSLDDLGGHTVRDVMTQDAVTVDVDAPVQDVAELLCRHRIHRVVVLEHGRVCGIVSSLDLVGVLARGGSG